ncbi:MAG: signal peptidase I [Deltaproteobacteria bacterium]|nr:signal peptidase I [Deltaproteobacteria bacterium]
MPRQKGTGENVGTVAEPRLRLKSQTSVQAKDGQKSVAREYTEALLVALVLAFFIRSFIVQAFKIPSGSMIPTLQIGDHILVNKFLYGLRLPYPFEKMLLEWKQPNRGDVIVFIYPKDRTKDFIKRVVGAPGDTVEIRHKQVFINGVKMDDPHAHFADDGREISGLRDNFGPVTVPPHQLFMMGDNRDSSHDSRFWGFVDLDDVKGKAFLIYWSWDGQDRWVRWERLGSLIP